MAVDKSIKQDDWEVDVEAQRMAAEKSYVDVGREGYDLPEMLRSLALDLEGSQGDALRKAADEIVRLRGHMELRVAQVNEYEPRMRQAEEEVARLREREAKLERENADWRKEAVDQQERYLAEKARVVQLEEALRHLSQPNWQARPTAQDALDMVAFASRALAHPEGETNE